MNIATLGTNTLVGLSALRELRLDNVRLMHLPDFLHGVANRLTHLEITGALPIDSLELLSGVSLPSLTDIRLRLNARNIVGPTVFRGAVFLTSVDMQNCRIELISPRVFYPFRHTLMYLNLVGNRLKTVSADMFDYLLPSGHLRIYLFDNPWNCECSLVELKKIVEKHPDNFPGPIVCTVPPNMVGQPIKSTTFCMSSPVEPPEILDEDLACDDQRTKGHRLLTRVFRSNDMGNTSLWLHPEDEGNIEDLTISQPDIQKMCIITNVCIRKSTSSQRFFPLPQLKPTQLYLFCLQKTDQLNRKCLAYFHPNTKKSKAVWLTNSEKSTFLVGLVVAMVILMTLSFLIGTIVFRQAPEEETPSAISNGSFTPVDVSQK